ncbi:unnamed protein product [Urochloa decumbens]|uniref:Uncharacterized protein n=1 Tax=Urochloa decumbens TaxID=240449 RepID=A0ABC8YHY4_9POAL
MARRSLAGGATAGAASRVRFAPTSNNLLVSSWDLVRVRSPHLAVPCGLGISLPPEFDGDANNSDFLSGNILRYDFGSSSHDTVGLHEDMVACIDYCHITGQIVTSSLDKKLQLWDTKVRNFSPNGTITFDSDVASLSICGTYISAAIARHVYFYDIRNLTGPVKAKFSPMAYQIRCLQASPEWNGYVAGSVDGVVTLNYLDGVTNGNMGYAFRCHPNSRNGKSILVPINCIAIQPRKKTFVTGDDGGYAIAWDAQSKKKLFELPSYSGSVASMAYNHSGQLLAVATNYCLEADKMVEKHEIFIETVDFKRKTHSVYHTSN